jgi:hypothetical protein
VEIQVPATAYLLDRVVVTADVLQTVIWQDGGLGLTDAKGRYYTIRRDFILKHFGAE